MMLDSPSDMFGR